jgi:hypothetical protein
MNSEAILITAIFLFLAIVIGFLDTSSNKVEKQGQNDQVKKQLPISSSEAVTVNK